MLSYVHWNDPQEAGDIPLELLDLAVEWLTINERSSYNNEEERDVLFYIRKMVIMFIMS